MNLSTIFNVEISNLSNSSTQSINFNADILFLFLEKKGQKSSGNWDPFHNKRKFMQLPSQHASSGEKKKVLEINKFSSFFCFSLHFFTFQPSSFIQVEYLTSLFFLIYPFLFYFSWMQTHNKKKKKKKAKGHTKKELTKKNYGIVAVIVLLLLFFSLTKKKLVKEKRWKIVLNDQNPKSGARRKNLKIYSLFLSLCFIFCEFYYFSYLHASTKVLKQQQQQQH